MGAVRTIAALVTVAALAGCGGMPDRERAAPEASAPVAAARPVAELRRLLLLPVVFDPAQCQWPEAAARLDASTVLFLQDWKGYQLLRSAPGDPNVTEQARALAVWQAQHPDGGTVTEPLRDELGALAGGVAADGVLVIHAAPRCGGYTTQALQAVARVVPDTIGGGAAEPLSATIFDGRGGATAWQRQVAPRTWAGAPPAGPSAFDMQRAAEELFHPIDNALPAVLERPRTPIPVTP